MSPWSQRRPLLKDAADARGAEADLGGHLAVAKALGYQLADVLGLLPLPCAGPSELFALGQSAQPASTAEAVHLLHVRIEAPAELRQEHQERLQAALAV